jgi:hypothetical protein
MMTIMGAALQMRILPWMSDVIIKYQVGSDRIRIPHRTSLYR